MHFGKKANKEMVTIMNKIVLIPFQITYFYLELFSKAFTFLIKTYFKVNSKVKSNFHLLLLRRKK